MLQRATWTRCSPRGRTASGCTLRWTTSPRWSSCKRPNCCSVGQWHCRAATRRRSGDGCACWCTTWCVRGCAARESPSCGCSTRRRWTPPTRTTASRWTCCRRWFGGEPPPNRTTACWSRWSPFQRRRAPNTTCGCAAAAGRHPPNASGSGSNPCSSPIPTTPDTGVVRLVVFNLIVFIISN